MIDQEKPLHGGREMIERGMEEEDMYPPGPAKVRPDLTRPTAAYRRHAYLAVAGVVLFLLAYAGAAVWFVVTAIRLFMSVPSASMGIALRVGGGIASAFMAVLMIKAAFFVRRGEIERDFEVTPASHPRLFAFLYRLADEARAPRPHRVFLSPRVNAGVYYDLSIVNLLFPSKKNLEIGLGLVNVLTLAELKAVLAHEFGHFAQRTMAVSRWIYTSQQIVGHAVARRDAFDHFLTRISYADPRVAWIGWGGRIVVWSIRSLIESAFGWVVLAQRALSREMELQADLVAVSLTGSDALVHALQRLEAADEAMDGAFGFADEEHAAGRTIADIFAVQSETIARTRTILGDPRYGDVPPLPEHPETHRLFKADFAQPPRMWSTHPPNNVREENAKREYIAAPLDDRSAWVLFEDPARARADMTGWVYSKIREKQPAAARPKLEAPPIAESLERLAKNFDRHLFDAAYRGVYLGRSCVRSFESVPELYGSPPADLAAELATLYPATLKVDRDRLRDLMRERAMLQGLERGVLETSGKLMRYRGQDYHRRELPSLIRRVDGELSDSRKVLVEHDKRVRAAYLAAARKVGPEWQGYLKAIATLLHYAEHREADLADLVGVLRNTVAVALVDRRVTSREIADIVGKAHGVYTALLALHNEAVNVHLGALAKAFDGTPWQTVLGPLKLQAPNHQNIGKWLDVVDSWAGAAGGALGKLAMTALDELLRVEREVGQLATSGTEGAGMPTPPPPEAPRVPLSYPTLVIGKERPRQTKLGLVDRFFIADGIGPGAARFLCAGAIVAVIMVAGYWVGNATVHVVNGLNRPVVVRVGNHEVTVPPRSHEEVDVHPSAHVSIRAQTKEGVEIESFEADASKAFGNYVYNIARAAPLAQYDPSDDKSELLGAPRWTSTRATQIVENPAGMKVKSTDPPLIFTGGDMDPSGILGAARDDEGMLAAAHMRWDPPGTPNLEIWFGGAQNQLDAGALLADRLAANPEDVMARRFEQERGPRAEVCERHRKQAADHPTSAAWQYLATRCIDDPAAKNDAFIALGAKWPNDPWVMYADAGSLMDRDDLDGAERVYARLTNMLPDERTAIAMARIRIAQIKGTKKAALFPAHDTMLDLVRDVERGGDHLEGDREVFRHLYLGELDAAVNSVHDKAGKTTIALIVGCSDGATYTQMKNGLVPADSVGEDNALYAYALALRMGSDPAPYRKLVNGSTPDAKRAFAFVDEVRAAEPANRLAIVPPVDLRERAKAYAAVTVLLGHQTPPAWRTFALHALFVFERPYFKAE